MKKTLSILLFIALVHPTNSFALDEQEVMPTISSASPQTITSIDETITITGTGFNNGDNRNLDCDDLRDSLGLKVTNWTDSSVQFKFDKSDWHYSNNAKDNYDCKIQVAREGTQDYFSNEINIEISLPQICSSWTYTEWSDCSKNGQKSRTVSTSSPENCTGGNPVLTQSCTYTEPTSQDSKGSFELIIPSGRSKGVLNNDKIKIEYYGSDIITGLYLNSKEISLGNDVFNIISYGPPILNHQIVSFYPPVNSKSGDLIVHTANDKTKNVGFLKIMETEENVDTDEPESISEDEEIETEETTNDSDGDGVPNNLDYYPNKKSELITKKYSFNYKMFGENHQDKVDFTIKIPKDLYLYYQNQNHVFNENYQNITSFITNEDPVIKTLIKKINTLYKEKKLNPMVLIYQLTGEVIYSEDKFSIKGWDEYPKYPIETLVEGEGDCEDTSFLLATLYKSFGIEPVLVRFDNHLGIATVADQEILDLFIYKHGKDFMEDANSKLTKSKLIYLESTGNTEWDFGYMPEQLQSKNYTIHTLSEYKRTKGSLQEETAPFSDIPSNHKNSTAIKYLKNNKIIDGYPDNSFKPENPINRAELMKILVEGKVGKPDVNEYKNCFKDITNQWYAPYVCYAKSAGWVDGYSDGKFRATQIVNKAEALKMLLNSQGLSIADTISSKPFNDVNTTDWYAKYVSKAKEINILEETGEVFNPNEGMKRGGISENLYRILIQ